LCRVSLLKKKVSSQSARDDAPDLYAPKRKIASMSRSLFAAALGIVSATSLLAFLPANADVVTPDFVVPDTGIAHPGTDEMHTDFLISTHPHFNYDPSNVPIGVTPTQLHAIYNVPSAGQGAIAIVDAYSYKNALTDFNKYSQSAGLPQEASKPATDPSNTVFQIVYADGVKPAANLGWNEEEALDIEISHSMAPNAKIYLVEASSNNGNALYKAVRVAASLPGVQEISMSWGGGESGSEKAVDTSTFAAAGIVYLASSGDDGAGAQYPASSPNVVGVGGTTLHFTSGAFTSETGWEDSGGGKSTVESTPAYQSGVTAVVGKRRGVPDIAADANPKSGVGVYINGQWQQYGGTSVASPLCAGIVNDADSLPANTAAELTKIYANLLTSNFRDITVGNNGHPCLVGYDLVTGVGSPNGAGAF
jgi:kumamolisin